MPRSRCQYREEMRDRYALDAARRNFFDNEKAKQAEEEDDMKKKDKKIRVEEAVIEVSTKYTCPN